MGPDFNNSATIGEGLDVIFNPEDTCRLYYMDVMDEIEKTKNTSLINGIAKGTTTSTLVESCWYYFDPNSIYRREGVGDNNIIGLPVGYSSEFLWLYSFFSADTYDDPPLINSTNILPTLTSPNFNLPFVPIPNTLNEFYWRITGDFSSPPKYEIINGEYELTKVTTVQGDSVMYIGINPVTGRFTNPSPTLL